MIIEQEVDIFLEHFGAKGMKWGVRKAKVKQTFSKSNPKAKRNKRIVAGVVATGVVVAGALIAHKSGIRVSSFRRSSSSKGSAKSAQILAKIGQERFKAIPMPPVPKTMPKPPRARPGLSEAKLLRSSIASMIKSTNSDMRKYDNDNNVPFANRLQLKEWD